MTDQIREQVMLQQLQLLKDLLSVEPNPTERDRVTSQYIALFRNYVRIYGHQPELEV